MAATEAFANLQTTTANGTGSTLTFADASNFVLGAHAWLQKPDGTGNQLCLILAVTATTVQVRFVVLAGNGDILPQPNYGGSDVSAYLTGSTLNQFPSQISNIAVGFDGY
jgi:hypothetical protein